MKRNSSKRIKLFPLMLLVTGVVSTAIIYVSSASNTNPNHGQGRRVPIAVLQSSEPVIGSDYGKKTMLALTKDGQSIYSLDSMTGALSVFERNGKSVRKIADSFWNVESFTVGPQNSLYLAQSDSTVQIVGADGRRLNAFQTVNPKSIAVLGNGNIVIASPFNGKILHLYNTQGLLLASFGELRTFDNNQRENEFLNEGRVVVGPHDEIYYVSMYAPRPYVARFGPGGQLMGEFPIEGDAIDLQTGFTNEFINRSDFCGSGGVTIITSASVSPDTGHLWLGMNGLSTQGTVYEYDQAGNKVREYAFLLNSKNRRRNVTHVKDIAVSGDSLSILTWGGTYDFRLSDPVIADAWKVPIKKAPATKLTGITWANFAVLAKSWAPAISRPGIPQPDEPPCEAQSYACTANCPANTSPNPANCGAEMQTFFPSNTTKVVKNSSCTAKPVDSTPGSATPGGCTQTVDWCDPSNGETGSVTVNVNCTAVPTPTPTPTPEPSPTPTPDSGCDAVEANACRIYGGTYDYSGCACTGGRCDYETGQGFCDAHDGDWISSTCTCHYSPVLIDVAGDGFNLTDASAGVRFDLNRDGTQEQVSWTTPTSDDAFLVLDRNANGTIDDASELFGNFTSQARPPAGAGRNGFNALSEFDKPSRGGNGDGQIDQRDAIFSQLRLWQDTNHNGISELSELHTLPDLGVDSISLDYKLSKRTDKFGNEFRYRAKVDDAKHQKVGRWAWDVFLVSN